MSPNAITPVIDCGAGFSYVNTILRVDSAGQAPGWV